MLLVSRADCISSEQVVCTKSKCIPESCSNPIALFRLLFRFQRNHLNLTGRTAAVPMRDKSRSAPGKHRGFLVASTSTEESLVTSSRTICKLSQELLWPRQTRSSRNVVIKKPKSVMGLLCRWTWLPLLLLKCVLWVKISIR